MHRVATAHVMVVGLLALRPRVVSADDVQSWAEIKLSILASDRIDWSVGGVAGFQERLALLCRKIEVAGTAIVVSCQDSIASRICDWNSESARARTREYINDRINQAMAVRRLLVSPLVPCPQTSCGRPATRRASSTHDLRGSRYRPNDALASPDVVLNVGSTGGGQPTDVFSTSYG